MVKFNGGIFFSPSAILSNSPLSNAKAKCFAAIGNLESVNNTCPV